MLWLWNLWRRDSLLLYGAATIHGGPVMLLLYQSSLPSHFHGGSPKHPVGSRGQKALQEANWHSPQKTKALILLPIKQCHLVKQMGQCGRTLSLFTLALTLIAEGRAGCYLPKAPSSKPDADKLFIYDQWMSPRVLILYLLLKPCRALSPALL